MEYICHLHRPHSIFPLSRLHLLTPAISPQQPIPPADVGLALPPPFHVVVIPIVGSSSIVPTLLYPSIFGCSWLFCYGHPKAGSLRTHPLPYPNLCASLFDGSNASGSIKWTSTQTTPADTSSSFHRVQILLIDDNPFNSLEDDDDDDDASNDTGARAPSDKADGGSTERPDKRSKTINASTDRPDKRAKTSDASTDRTDMDKASKTSVCLDELSLDMQNALQHMVKSKEAS
ncbi:unnamed protein product [Lactuca saligna]|uniref:Uncharacterized protein n=1 Tax=Lactuca saligna TaxID=75948 RepID=A0AA35ZIZ5_LACSI|nr:unnamed protein product [Lactuca saligna]